MADALCGPSNALTSLQKHSSVDRTLQHDRLVQRQTPGHQGFRSASPYTSNNLDAEFEAFQAGLPVDHLHSHTPLAHRPQQHFSPPPPTLAAGPSWANDFQRMHISPPKSPLHELHHTPGRQRHVASGGGWAQDFMGQNSTPAFSQTQFGPHTSMLGTNGSYGYGRMGQAPLIGQEAQMSSPHMVHHDHAAFDAAFDEVGEMLRQEESVKAGKQAQMPEQVLEESTVEAILQDVDTVTASQKHSNHLAEADRLEKDLAYEDVHPFAEREEQAAEESKESPDKNDDDELAKTAGQLLDSVSHDQSEKFQQSTFLALMRRLRDHEVRVEGDKMVEVDTEQPLSGPQLPQKSDLEWMVQDGGLIPPSEQDDDAWKDRSPPYHGKPAHEPPRSTNGL